MATRESTTVNGIDMEILDGYVDGMRHPGPHLATARLRHRWKNGCAVEGRVEELEEAGETVVRSHHRFRTDWPRPFSGDSGPTPGLEMVLGAVAACAATTCAIKAAMRGIVLEELQVGVEGRVDMKGVFEVDDVRPGLTDLKVTLYIRSDEDGATIEALGRNVRQTSPMMDTLATPVPLDLSVERLR